MDTYLPHSLQSQGAEIRYGISGSGTRDLVLVHGNGAHHMWWHAIAPALEKDWRLITLDLSGHGDSDHRIQYEPELWVTEIWDVLDAAGSERPVYVGHSMGGRAGIAFAATHPERLSGLVVLDASIRPPSRQRDLRSNRARSPKRVYPDYEEALSRFRLMPVQPEPPRAVMGPLSHYSLKKVDGGWTWKHDPNSLMRFKDDVLDRQARQVKAPMVYVYAAGSVVVDDELAQYAGSVTQGPSEVIRIEDTYHHLVLDAPEACARIIGNAADRFHRQSATPAKA